jgi:hypothetical protein
MIPGQFSFSVLASLARVPDLRPERDASFPGWQAHGLEGCCPAVMYGWTDVLIKSPDAAWRGIFAAI